MLDLDRPVTDRLLLRTVPGAVDYLAEELRELPTAGIVGRRHDGVVIEFAGPLRDLAANRYYTTLAVLTADDAGIARSRESGALAAVPEPPRFRVGRLGERRWPLRDRLTASGWRNAPGDWDVNFEPDPEGTAAELGGMYWTSRFGELVRAPASTTPVIATVMLRLAKVQEGQRVLDPFCGAGTLLVEAARGGAGRLLGADHDRRWVRSTRENLAGAHPPVTLWRGDARALPLPDDHVDRVVANLPFGKRVGSHRGNTTLYPAALAEIARVLTRTGRAVLLTEDKRLFTETVQRTRGVRIVKQITFTTGGAHPSAYVVTTRRGR
ncbi:TRM11 family SAM-dependent methyltransferase [Stackebrandtia albiflava]|uniref:TRM11 family SAM-dependent methyltransferase n=1 Tax=Stackebrandtia albiflava TaxID=406432 RepID=UPI0011BFE662|nr:methyltransferase domain-containing protein [Stackebrandtia albiflava]